METQGLKQRHPLASVPVIEKLRKERTGQSTEPTAHPAGKPKHGVLHQALRMCLFALYFNGSIIAWVYTVR